MTNLRLVLLASTALTVMQFASTASHAQTAPIVVAQAKEELGPDGKPKPKGPPPKAAPAPAKPAAPPPPPKPPVAQPPQRPAPPPPPHAVPPPPPRATPPAPPTPHAQPEISHPTPPATSTPPVAPKPPTPPPGGPAAHEHEPQAPGQAPGGARPPGGGPTAPTPQVVPQKETAPTTPNGVRPQVVPPNNTAPAAQPNVAPSGPGGRPPGQGAGAAPGGGAPFARRAAPTITTPLPAVPAPAQGLRPLAAGAPAPGPRSLNDFRAERHETQEGGRTVITEPGRVIIRDPNGEAFIRHDEVARFAFGARDIQTQQVGGETRTIVIRPDGSQIITIVGADGQLLRRIRRDQQGREIIIIDNSYRDPRAVGGFYVDLPPPVIRIPYDRYIVDAADAPPDLIYDTMEAPPVDRIDRRYSLDEIRYSPSVRMLMPSIDLSSINFETGSWEIPPDQAAKLQVIADGLNRAIQRNPREVFLIEGHTDAVGNDVDNLSLSDRRAESAAELLTQQFQVPAENLTSQGYGSQYLKEQTDGPSRINRRVTVRRITPLLNGGVATLPPPPPGTIPPR
jgi:outer membrane protein OmpA-like peptidoglycan-associated protein